MTLVEFEVVELHQSGPGQIQKAVYQAPVNLDTLCFVKPAAIPSELSDPQGRPMPQIVTGLVLACGPIVVNCKMEEAVKKIKEATGCQNIPVVESVEPMVKVEEDSTPEDDEPESNIIKFDRN